MSSWLGMKPVELLKAPDSLSPESSTPTDTFMEVLMIEAMTPHPSGASMSTSMS